MKLQFKHQKFQAEAAKAVCDVFAGQPYFVPSYMIDKGLIKDKNDSAQKQADIGLDFTGWRNEPIAPQLTDEIILENINRIQRKFQIEPSQKLEGRYNLTVEMETGVWQNIYLYKDNVRT